MPSSPSSGWEERLSSALGQVSADDPIKGIQLARRWRVELTALAEQMSAQACIAAREAGLTWPQIIGAPSAEISPSIEGIPSADTCVPKLWNSLHASYLIARNRGPDAQIEPHDMWRGMLTVKDGSAATIIRVLQGNGPTQRAVAELEKSPHYEPPLRVGEDPKQASAAALRKRSAYTPQSYQLLEATAQLSAEWGHDFLGTEHLMLVMLDPQQPAWEGRSALNLSYSDIYTELSAMLSSIGLPVPDTKPSHHTSAPSIGENDS